MKLFLSLLFSLIPNKFAIFNTFYILVSSNFFIISSAKKIDRNVSPKSTQKKTKTFFCFFIPSIKSPLFTIYSTHVHAQIEQHHQTGVIIFKRCKWFALFCQVSWDDSLYVLALSLTSFSMLRFLIFLKCLIFLTKLLNTLILSSQFFSVFKLK